MNKSAVNRFSYRSGPAWNMELAEQAFDVRLHGAFGNPQAVGDDFVALTLGNEP